MNEKLIKEITEEAVKLWPENFDDYEKEFNRSCFAVCLKIIKELNIFKKEGDRASFNELKISINLNPDAEYLFSKILYILTEEGYLKKEGEYFCFNKKSELPGATELLVELARKYPDESASFQWVARAFDGMIDFIKGEVYPEDIMFPWGSFELVEDVYNNSKIYGFYSKLAAITVKKFIELHFKRRVKLLEAGAGTGNGTRELFNLTDNMFEEYIFTDISKSLIKKSSKTFDKDFMLFKVYDVNKDFAEQGFEKESCDVILAVNVIHAVHNAGFTIKTLYDLLKKDGVLVISEISPPFGSTYRYMDLTFGLLPSYSNYGDKDLRPDAPIVTADRWIEIFKKAGFIEIDAVPYNKFGASDRGGVVIGIK